MAFPFLKQYDSMDCGPTCLAMICKHFGKSTPVQTLREKTQIGKEGVNMLGISDAAEIIGFRTQSIKIPLINIIEASLPCILHWNQNHFVVLYKIRRNTFYIANPAKGLQTYKHTEFKSHWVSDKSNGLEQGIALLVEPTPAFYEGVQEEEKKPQGLAFRNIFNYILPYKKLIFQLFLGLGIGSILQLVLPFLTQSIVDVGINTANIHFVYVVLLAQLALFAGRMIMDFVRSWILMHISTRINISLLTDFLIKLMQLPLSFFDSRKTGDILQRMNDHSRIESFLTGPSLNIIFSFINLVIFSIVLAYFNSTIFAIFLFSSLLYSGWVVIFMKKRKALDQKRFELSSKKQSATIQLVQGMQEIKLNGCEKTMRWAWERLQASLFKLSMKGLVISQVQQSGAFFINEGKGIFISFLSAKAVIDGQMTLGSMLAVQYILGQLSSPFSQMIGFAQSWQNAKISMDRLNEIHTIEDEEPKHIQFQYQLPASFTKKLIGGRGSAERLNELPSELPTPDLYDLPVPVLENNVAGAICFHNVSFTYSGAGNEPVLKDINLQIPKGKITAIVGTSGSGKTTLLKLLLKFYIPQKGEIKLDHASLANISHKVWRSHCGTVMQESFIFSDTIARNIAVGVERIDMERLYDAVDMANAREFIESLPLGYNTKIGSEGIGISTGQKQRIMIARAVYRNPDFIFFDEATNSLDANNESIILKNLERFFKGRTVVVVAHRLSTVKNADQIVLLNKGIIEERGTHQELINLKGEYYTLIKNQLELGT